MSILGVAIWGLAASQELDESTPSSCRGKRPHPINKSGHQSVSPEVPPTDPTCVLSGAQTDSGLSNTLPGHTGWRDLTRRTQVPRVHYHSRNGCGHHKPDTCLTQRTLTAPLNHHKPWEGSSVSILQMRKLRVREASHCLRSLSLQWGSEPWAMSAQEPGWEGPMCPPHWP